MRPALADASASLVSLLQQINQDARLDSRELDDLVALLAKVDERVAAWLASSGAAGLPSQAAPPWLADRNCPWRVANPVLLHSARAATLAGRCEDAVGWLALREANKTRPSGSTPADGEAIALYYRALASHQLVRLSDAKEAAEALLALPTAETAARHRRIAKLIRDDAGRTDEESLRFVAKLMGDSRRRLALGRSGEAPQKLQQDIVSRLDKLIDELEQQQKQQQQQEQSSSQPSARVEQPLEASRPAELKKPGDVDGPGAPPSGDWGSLPPAERERVTQQIIRDFPGHYRSLIEDYFRSLANPPGVQGSESDQPAEAANR